MAKIYQFPQGEERAKFRKEIARERKKCFAVKTGSTFVKWLGWGWFYLRLLAASVLHFIFVFVLAILGAFRWAVFWLGGILYLDHQLWTPQNLTIPVITATWIFGLLAEPLMELLNKTMPWHKLLVPEPAGESTENSSETSQ